LIIFDSTINLATILLLDPLVVLQLERTMSLGGDRFVGNTALISFAASAAGMASFAVAGIGLILANVVGGWGTESGDLGRAAGPACPPAALYGVCLSGVCPRF
jgi:hypothetical protein